MLSTPSKNVPFDWLRVSETVEEGGGTCHIAGRMQAVRRDTAPTPFGLIDPSGGAVR